MSLKAFHIIFVTACTLLAFGFGAWALHSYSTTKATLDLVMAIVALVCGVGMIWYGRYFLKKLKNISYL
ncbi:MAG: hypothetical protein H0X66_18925 [Verrucomicrobia bacterium]|nr:hypothetical protein [Verrucomicrobiota bacterium]